MENFGVQEILHSKATTAPGWAYVPDTGVSVSAAALQPASRGKRFRNVQAIASGETTARQDAKILRELAALDRENHRDATISTPIRHRDKAGQVNHGKVTPAVRKILQSQKTFANYLADFEAACAQSSYAPTSQSVPVPPTPVIDSTPNRAVLAEETQVMSGRKRSNRRKGSVAPTTTTSLRHTSSASQRLSIAEPSPKSADVEMTGVRTPLLIQGKSALPAPHPGDEDLLLLSRIPGIPSDTELQRLLAEPPLMYTEAKGRWVDEDRRKPVRVFCERCGYWGRSKCTKCGAKVCALDCYNEHMEECQRYGA